MPITVSYHNRPVCNCVGDTCFFDGDHTQEEGCTCRTSDKCLLHYPPDGIPSKSKEPINLYIILDVETERLENYPFDELLTVEHVEILPTVYKTPEEARIAALQLVLQHLDKYGDPYDEIEDHEGLLYIWENEWGDYVGIKELTLGE